MPDFSSPYTYGDHPDYGGGVSCVDASLSSDDSEWIVPILVERFFEEADLMIPHKVNWSGDEGDFDFDVYPAEYGSELIDALKENYDPEDDDEGFFAKAILAFEAHTRAEKRLWAQEKKERDARLAK